MTFNDYICEKYSKLFPRYIYFECASGWNELIEAMCKELTAICDDNFYGITQIKEKYGKLRVYCASATDEIYDILDKYEQKSSTICEHCSLEGKLQKHRGWIYTICENCKAALH